MLMYGIGSFEAVVVMFAADSGVALIVVSFRNEVVVITGSLVVELMYGVGSPAVIVIFA